MVEKGLIAKLVTLRTMLEVVKMDEIKLEIKIMGYILILTLKDFQKNGHFSKNAATDRLK